MDKVSFSGLEIPANSILPGPYRNGPMNRNWIRVKFTMNSANPDFAKVEDWLRKNCKHGWAAYNHVDPSDSSSYFGIVRFENNDDALMFKLSDGHQAWRD